MSTIRKNKMIRNIDHEKWEQTTKRARRTEGLEVSELLEKLFDEYNLKIDTIELGKSSKENLEPSVQILD